MRGDAATSTPELTLGSGAPAAEPAEPTSGTHECVDGSIGSASPWERAAARRPWLGCVFSRGSGKLTINDRPLEDYFRVERNRALVEGPLPATDTLGKVDIWVRAQGGGTTGQVGAIVLGIARALQAMDPGIACPPERRRLSHA